MEQTTLYRSPRRAAIVAAAALAWLSASAVAAQSASTSVAAGDKGAPAAGTAAATPVAAPAAASVPAADPSAEVQVEYRDVVVRAIAEFEAGRWAEARALFLRGHELWPSARTYRTLGMTSFELRTYALALQELQAALDDARKPLDDAQRREVEALVERTRAFVGRYRVSLSPETAELLVDGKPTTLAGAPLVLEVGDHELIARAPGHGELRRRLLVQGREDQEIALSLVAETLAGAPVPTAAASASADSPASQVAPVDGGGRLWTWIVGGTAVALGGASTFLWLRADSEFDELKRECDATPCVEGETDTKFEGLETAHQVTLGLAIAAGVGAVVLFFVEGGGDEAPPSVSLGPGGAAFEGRF